MDEEGILAQPGKTLEQQVKDALSPIRITPEAIDKANLISRRVCELMCGSFEIGFFMTSGQEPEGEKLTITDTYIAHNQEVKSDYCDIKGSGKIISFKDINGRQKRAIAAWGHSHAGMNTSCSRRDRTTIADLVRTWGMEKEIHLDRDAAASIRLVRSPKGRSIQVRYPGNIPIMLQSEVLDILDEKYLISHPWKASVTKSVRIKYFYGITFNAKGDEPFCVIAYMLDSREISIIHGVGYEAVEHDYKAEISKEQIDQELTARIVGLRDAIERQEREKGRIVACVQDSHYEGIKAHDYLSSKSPYEIASNPESCYSQASVLAAEIEKLAQADEACRAYSSTGAITHEQAGKTIAQIAELREKLQRMMETNAGHYSETLRLLGEYPKGFSVLKIQSIHNEMAGLYSGFVAFIKEYSSRRDVLGGEQDEHADAGKA